MTIETLIDYVEAFELARDSVAQILADESASQQALATAAGKDPTLWAFDVYTERADPIERWLRGHTAPTTPFVNVWFESADYDAKNSSVAPTREGCVIHVDCHAFATSKATAEGHDPSDEAAARAVQRVARIVRQILDAGHYTYLGSPRGAAQWCYGSRVRRIQAYQPQIDAQNVGRVQGCRVTLDVKLNQTTKQTQGDVLEILDITARRDTDGKVLARVTIDNS